jgi:hypothetical protein
MSKTKAYGEQIWDENRRFHPTGVYEYVGGESAVFAKTESQWRTNF